MKYADIAETLGIPVGTVKSRMHAVTTRLRELLEEDGLEL
jgi:DNA-directed RNA polymerase specialized sigma24 family protein